MTDSTRTDPRFHPAYQRGYQRQGAPTLEAAPAEERFRRPRGGEAAQGRRRSTAAEAPALPTAFAGVESDVGQAPVDDVATEAGPAVPRRPSALDRRVPLALAVLGALFLVSGLGLLWTATSSMYGGIGVEQTEFDRFVSAITNYLAGPAVTIGLLSIGAAIAVRAARS
ncbi:hypothetical protein [Rathayibacter sp. VKM Ac-2760]|uniref:hypothetical protein n=1 Tax=Rathayibacter sp. VKM Ac-2760 TaxID=2609253 RepID=UPI0013181DF8|nr:hypothetical protein [Rathayibacter sp. VKM Ac-2760]QHC57725.1 hypothetical protein GSU72_03400 [Rathayibacter sp. VKM Ac-2760]